jgi:hypothetical protein
MFMSTIERLSDEYRQADLHPRELELVHEDELMEAYVNFWLWPYLFWIIFIAAIILPGVIGR